VRVIAGEFKGRRLAVPRWEGVRPTSDKLRETLFNVLARRTPGARVVDGFAGTGAIGIEALSRGASHVTFVERDARALKLIAENLARCGVPAERYTIVRADFLRLRHEGRAAAADLVLLDPPYDLTEGDAVLAAAAEALAPGGLVVLEHARRRAAPERGAGLQRTRLLVSGDSALSLYEAE
jgi:16S rRNA (guanine(966)-N(2))-methyltransferase RsmD